MEGEQAEVDQRAGHRLAVDAQVLLGQVPAARAHQQRRDLVAQLVVPAVGAVVGDRALDRVDEVRVAGDLVGPGGRVRVLEVGHEARAPELSALITSLRSVGPVISTRRSA